MRLESSTQLGSSKETTRRASPLIDGSSKPGRIGEALRFGAKGNNSPNELLRTDCDTASNLLP